MPVFAQPLNRRLLAHDIVILAAMGLLAACGLIYEYLLAHYAGFVLGSVESTIYGMIGLMIVAMGLGAFSASRIRDSFQAFVWLELAIACIGGSCILVLATLQAISKIIPQILSQHFGLPDDIWLDGGFLQQGQKYLRLLPYATGFILGWLIGMEIPLLARIREHIHQKHLSNNTGTLYGADYIGAGLGAAIWVSLLLTLDISRAGTLTAGGNLLVGLLFVLIYRQRLDNWRKLLLLHLVLLAGAIGLFRIGPDWMLQLESLLYRDPIIYSHSSKYQHLVLTERRLGQNPVTSLYLNGRLQFSSEDEALYHRLLVHPAMLQVAQPQRVLIIGGGDGLALREVFRWPVQQVVLVDLDVELLNLFRLPGPEAFRQQLQQLNGFSLRDPRLELRINDGFIEVDRLLAEHRQFDVIILDLPDPSHPDLNKVYSTDFYQRLKLLLSEQGAMVVQSTSPYHAHDAFICIGKTLTAAGFIMEQYHANIPSFGEWGFSLATRTLPRPSQRLQQLQQLPFQDDWLSLPLIQASFVFPADFYHNANQIGVNRLSNTLVYSYHQQAWQQQQGGFYRLFLSARD